MYSNILVPIAPEEPLANSPSIKFAREILAPDGKITVISVVEVPPAYASAYIPKTQAKSLLQLQAKEMANRLSEMAKVEARAIQGHPARAILDEAKDMCADCIVIASHRPGPRHFFLGSTASRVVRRSECAVHVLR